MPIGSQSCGTLEEFVASAPLMQRVGMRMLVALARRPRGAALLGHVPAVNQLAQLILALGHYDDPPVARALGWDAADVVARGRALRLAEGRP